MDNFYLLKPGIVFDCDLGKASVIEFIDYGSQGEIYLVEINKKRYAFKFFYKHLANNDLKNSILSLIKSSFNIDGFTWPLSLVELNDSFGYVMNLKPKDYVSGNYCMSNDISMNYDTYIKLCINLCDAIQKIHACDYSFNDISLSNMTFSPQSGDILLVDCENISKNECSSNVVGTCGYMAPELISNRFLSPSTKTDLHSLAVVLFQMLIGVHPYDGKKEYYMSGDKTNEDVELLYGVNNAQFIFADENDLDKYIVDTEPSHISAKYWWNFQPDAIKELFKRAFVDGVNNPKKRPIASIWKKAFINYLGMLQKCDYCGNIQISSCNSSVYQRCTECKSKLFVPYLLVNNIKIPLQNNKVIFENFFNSYEGFKQLIFVDFRNNSVRFKNLSCAKFVFDNVIYKRNETTPYVSKNIDLEIERFKCKLYLEENIL